MTVRTLTLIALPALALLGACADTPPITATSTCHTSDGQFVNAPGCTISYSTSRTVTTTTTTVTVVEQNAPAEDAEEER